jgi:hypothetical protein
MLSVILVSILVGLGSISFCVPGRDVRQGLFLSSSLLLCAILLYNGYSGFRIPFGVLYLTIAFSLLFVAIVRPQIGSGDFWFHVSASVGLAFCAWVILISRHGKCFLEARAQWLSSLRAN